MNGVLQELKSVLGQFWDDRAIPLDGAPQSTDELGAPLDSLTAMEVLVEIDRMLKRKVPVEEVIRKGGYQSREQFVEEISERAWQYVSEHRQ